MDRSEFGQVFNEVQELWFGKECRRVRDLKIRGPILGYIINTARGPIIDEKALIEALESGSIAGAGLDVFEEEPTPTDNPLLKRENVIVAPHSIAWTQECIRDNSLHSCRNVLSIYKGEAPKHVANPQVVERSGFQAKLAARRS